MYARLSSLKGWAGTLSNESFRLDSYSQFHGHFVGMARVVALTLRTEHNTQGSLALEVFKCAAAAVYLDIDSMLTTACK
jgi:hypothetical protein